MHANHLRLLPFFGSFWREQGLEGRDGRPVDQISALRGSHFALIPNGPETNSTGVRPSSSLWYITPR